MYERLLDKNHQPSDEEYIAYCGLMKEYFIELDSFLLNELQLQKIMRFPYGNQYGWSFKYTSKNKLVCDIFAEKDAFTMMLRLDDNQYNQVLPFVSKKTQNLIQNKYPCGDAGGWIHLRVLNQKEYKDAKNLLCIKVKHELQV